MTGRASTQLRVASPCCPLQQGQQGCAEGLAPQQAQHVLLSAVTTAPGSSRISSGHAGKRWLWELSLAHLAPSRKQGRAQLCGPTPRRLQQCCPCRVTSQAATGTATFPGCQQESGTTRSHGVVPGSAPACSWPRVLSLLCCQRWHLKLAAASHPSAHLLLRANCQ